MIKQAFLRQAGLIGVGVAAAVVTPIVLLPGGQPTEAAAAGHVGEAVAVLRYQPSWLPDGAYESGRSFAGQGSLARTWHLPGGEGGRQRSATLSSVDQAPLPAEGRTVDINGVTGKLVKDHLMTFVAWIPEPGRRLSVSILATGDVTETVLRIARSVKPDGNAEFEWPLSFEWLPQQMRPSGFTISGSNPRDVDVSATADPSPPSEEQEAIWVDIGSLAELPDGEPVTVRGKQGVFMPGDSSSEIDVELEPGRWLRVSGPLSKQDLIRLTDSIKVGPLDYPWLGTR